MSVCISICKVVVVNGYSCQILWFIVVYIKVFALSIVRPLERLSIEAGLVLSSIVFIQFAFFVYALFMKWNHL